jgi:hypothetical protein
MSAPNAPAPTDESGDALDHPVRVSTGAWPDSDCQAMERFVLPSEVVAAHNAQSADPADRLVTNRAARLTCTGLETERDEARAEVGRLREALSRVTTRDVFKHGFDACQIIAREALLGYGYCAGCDVPVPIGSTLCGGCGVE